MDDSTREGDGNESRESENQEQNRSAGVEEGGNGVYNLSISNLNFRDDEEQTDRAAVRVTEEALASLRQRAEEDDQEALAALADFVVAFRQQSPSELAHAMHLYLRAWELGYQLTASQMTNLADILTSGTVTIDSSALYASQLYQLAMREGYVRAWHNYGVLRLRGGPGLERNINQAARLFAAAAERGHERALINLGILIQEEVPLTGVNVPNIFRLLEQAEGHGNENVLNSLAYLLMTGEDGIEMDVPRAIRLLERSVEAGSGFAMRHLATIIRRGSADVQADLPRAVELYEQAVQNDDSIAAELLARILVNDVDGVEPNAPRAVELFRMAISNGSISARNSLAQLLIDGADGVESNPPEAVTLLEEAIELANDTTSMMKLGLTLLEGAEGVPKNSERGMDLLERAVAQEDADATLVLGLILTSGMEDIPPNPSRAVGLLEKASSMGSVEAVLWLARVLFFGAENVDKDPARSVSLLERAVAEGNHEAGEFLAFILCDGADGVPADPHRAVRLYKKAIEEGGRDTALVELGVLFYKGAVGLPRDPLRAFRLFEQAAERHQEVGMCNLAVMLVVGRDGIAKDKRKAKSLYEKAIEMKNSVMAKTYLSMLLWIDGENLRHAIQLCDEAIQEEYLPAFPVLATFLRIGCDSLEKDIQRAIFLCEKASLDEDDPTYLLVMANLLTEGESSEHWDGPAAVQIYESFISTERDQSKLVWVKSSLRDSRTKLPFRGWLHGVLPETQVVLNPATLAMVNYASLLIDGLAEVPRDPSRAVQLYRRVIEEEGNCVLAMTNLAYLLCTPSLDVGIDPDGREGIRLLEMAISAENNATAMLVLANYLVDEVNQDYKNPHRAAELYRTVIRETSDAQAFRSLYNLLLNGADGFPMDPEGARRLLRSAAECGVIIN